ncbi:MAG: NRDE family protein [Nevskia sp.]|nr:NRDE family protein [Nevskia sp.]
MCLIAVAWNPAEELPLVLASNRDEFHQRPSLPLARWREQPQVIGGRDLREGGGWLALHEAGRLAAVTNVRAPAAGSAPLSRGRLVRDFVAGADGAAAYARARNTDGAAFGPFNLLAWDGATLAFASNAPGASRIAGPGIYGVSNGTLDEEWPKQRHLSARLRRWLEQRPDPADPDLEPLLAALADAREADDGELPDSGVGLARERWLSAAFIRSPAYGTRASSVVIVRRDGRTTFFERRFDAEGMACGDSRIELRLPPPRAAAPTPSATATATGFHA